ncbi:uncharacterized protein G2W53_041213 [Senna tora]|uniref:Uncharacterized protein n=1 Tax=Senna tora TaxID=362788 RepID=A0A834VYI4_9FABA|nr:uncharacterized protein G2W53_041213 [Senna tora]
MAMHGIGGEGEQVEGIVETLKECLDHIVPRPQAFFTKAYVPLECKPCEAEIELPKKELLVSSPLFMDMRAS